MIKSIFNSLIIVVVAVVVVVVMAAAAVVVVGWLHELEVQALDLLTLDRRLEFP